MRQTDDLCKLVLPRTHTVHRMNAKTVAVRLAAGRSPGTRQLHEGADGRADGSLCLIASVMRAKR